MLCVILRIGCPLYPKIYLQIYEEKTKRVCNFPNFIQKNVYLCTRNQGGLAQLARALAWHARGHEFDSRILHQSQERHSKGVVLGFYAMLGRTRDLRSLPYQREVWRDCKYSPNGGARASPSSTLVFSTKKGRPHEVCLFLWRIGVTHPLNPPPVRGTFGFYAMSESNS